MDNNLQIIQEGKVISIEDELGAGRIKVLLKSDYRKCNTKNSTLEDCAQYAFPLLPKTFQSVPKKGEIVFVFAKQLDNQKSQLFYIGPVISQPQMFYKDSDGQSTSVLQGSSDSFNPLKSISLNKDTKGSFPEPNDISLIGRKSEDITLKDGEIDLRCGIRTEGHSDDKDMIGNIILNTNSPSYIQLKYNKSGITKSGLEKESNSVINVVADKINLISYRNEQGYLSLTNDYVNKGKLLDDKSIENLMDKLHQVPYGDILIEYLEIFRQAFLSHVHPYPGLVPCATSDVIKTASLDFKKTLSPNVRIG